MSRAALADARAAAQALPALITAERLTLGSSTSHELIHERARPIRSRRRSRRPPN